MPVNNCLGLAVNFNVRNTKRPGGPVLAELPQQCLCLQPESMRQFRTHHPRPLDVWCSCQKVKKWTQLSIVQRLFLT